MPEATLYCALRELPMQERFTHALCIDMSNSQSQTKFWQRKLPTLGSLQEAWEELIRLW